MSENIKDKIIDELGDIQIFKNNKNENRKT